MEWFIGAALLPLLLCGLMCVGGILLAVVGLRSTQPKQQDCCPTHAKASDQLRTEQLQADA